MLSLFQRKRVPPAAGTPPTSAIETTKGSTAPGVGPTAAGHAASAETAGTHLAAHLALAPAVRHALPRPTGALRRAGPAVPGLREPPPRLSGRHAGPRPGDRRLCAEIAAVIPAACGRHARGTGGPGRSLDRRHGLRGPAARHR